MNPIDKKPDEPGQSTIKVPPCFGCGGMPHRGINEEIACLQEQLKAARTVLHHIKFMCEETLLLAQHRSRP